MDWKNTLKMHLEEKLYALISLFLISAAGFLGWQSYHTRQLAFNYFTNVAYYLIILLFLLWGITLVKYFSTVRPCVKSFLRENWTGLLFCLAMTIIVFISVKPYFRILSDETNLLAVSKSMFYERKTDNITQGGWYYFNFHPDTRVMEKRPLLFPFLTNILHVFFGYSMSHPFMINFAGLFTFFSLIFLFMKKHLGRIAGYAGVLLVAAQPVLTQASASAGFDLIYVLFIFICFYSLDCFLRKPTAINFQFLWIYLLLLANARYQAPVFFGITLLLLLILKYVKWDYFKSTLVFACTPLILLPTFWQRIVIGTNLQNPAGIKPFAPGHFINHQALFFKTLLRFDFELPYASLVNILGIAALIALMLLFVFKDWPKEKSTKNLLSITFLWGLAEWIIINSHFSAFLLDPSACRVFTLPMVALSLLATVFFFKIPFFKNKQGYLAVIALGFFFLYHPVAIENRFTNKLLIGRDYRIVQDFLKKYDKQHLLIIANRPGQYTVYDYGAINFNKANQDKFTVQSQIRNHLYEDVITIQEIAYGEGKAINDTFLDPSYTLEPLLELQKDGRSFLRISRVINTINR